MQLLNQTNGQVEDIPDDQTQAAFQSGKYAFIKGDDYAFTNPQDGKTAVVGADEAAKRVAQGQKPDLNADTDALLRAEKYGDQTSAIGEYSRGFLNTLTFGGADAAALAASEALGGKENRHELAEKMQASEELHPIAHYAGVGTGFVAPLLATGGAAAVPELGEGAGLLAKGANLLGKVGRAGAAPFEALSGAGTAGESIAKALVGEASENVVARVLQKGIAKGAGAAIEASIISGADQLHEDALGDHELNGEKLAAAMGHGALFGVMLGGGLGASGELLSSGTRWALTKASPAAKAASAEMAVRSLSYGGLAPKAYMNSLERLPGGVRGVGDALLANDLIRAGDTFETIAPRLRAAADEAGQGLTQGLQKLDAAGVQGPKIADVWSKVNSEIEGQFGKLRNTHAGTFKKVETLMSDFGAAFEGPSATLEGLRDFRKLIDQDIRWSATAPGAPMNATQEALKTVRGVIESELESTIDKAGENLSGDALKEYKALKLKYRQLTTAADLAEDSVTRAQNSQMFGVSTKLTAGMGIVHGLATDNPLAAVGGLAAAGLHHVVAERGASTAAVALNKLSDLTAIRKTIESIDARADGAVAGFLEGKKPEFEAKVFKSAKSRDGAFDAASKRVRIASSDPEKAADSVSKALGSAQVHAPKIAKFATQTAARAAVYLAKHLPSTPPAKTITPQFEHPQPTPEEKMKFLRRVRAADDPLSVLDDMQRGKLTREGVDTLREVYPKLYETLQQDAIERCADAKKRLSYDQKVQLGTLLDIPTDATLEPDRVAGYQAIYQQDNSAPQTAPKRPLAKVETSMRLNERRSN